jgi:hypothetical protein
MAVAAPPPLAPPAPVVETEVPAPPAGYTEPVAPNGAVEPFPTESTPDGGVVIIHLSGEIEPAILTRIRATAQKLDAARVLVVDLNSPGGNVGTAIQLGRVVRQVGALTMVGDGEGCYSACSLIYLAGVARSLGRGAKLGLHRPYAIEVGSTEDYQQMLGLIRDYLTSLNVSPRVYDIMVSTPPASIRVFMAGEAENQELGIEGTDPVWEERMADVNAARFHITKQEFYERDPLAQEACPGVTTAAMACYDRVMRTGQ